MQRGAKRQRSWQVEPAARVNEVREVIATLEADGWYLARSKGSHRQFRHPSKPGTVTVAGKSGVDVPIGTLGSIWKQAGLKKVE